MAAAAAGVRRAERQMTKARAKVASMTKTIGKAPNGDAVDTPAQDHAGRDCHQVAPQSTTRPANSPSKPSKILARPAGSVGGTPVTPTQVHVARDCRPSAPLNLVEPEKKPIRSVGSVSGAAVALAQAGVARDGRQVVPQSMTQPEKTSSQPAGNAPVALSQAHAVLDRQQVAPQRTTQPEKNQTQTVGRVGDGAVSTAQQTAPQGTAQPAVVPSQPVSDAEVTPAKIHVACGCHQTTAQSTAQPEKRPSRPVCDASGAPAKVHFARNGNRTAPQVRAQLVVSPAQPDGNAAVVLAQTGVARDCYQTASQATAQPVLPSHCAKKAMPPWSEVPAAVRQPPGAVAVAARSGPKNVEGPKVGGGARASSTTEAELSSMNSFYQNQVAGLQEALRDSQQKLNLAMKELATAKQAVVNASAVKQNKGSEQRTNTERVEVSLREGRDKSRNLWHRSVVVGHALATAEEANVAAKKTKNKEAEAKMRKLTQEASRAQHLEKQLEGKKMLLRQQKAEVAKLRSDTRVIEDLRKTIVAKVRRFVVLYTSSFPHVTPSMGYRSLQPQKRRLRRQKIGITGIIN